MSFRKDTILKTQNINFQTYIFNLFDYILRDDTTSIGIEIQLLMIQFFQLLSFIFTPLYISTWKGTKAYNVLSLIFGSFRLLPLFQGHPSFYLLFFYFCVVYLILFIVLLIYIAKSLTSNIFSILWPLRIVKMLTKLTAEILFIPLLSTFLSVLNCPKGMNYYSPNDICFKGVYIFHSIIGCLMAVILIYIMIQYTLLAFDIKYNPKNFRAKSLFIPDIFYLAEQIVFIIFGEAIRSLDINTICYFSISMIVALVFYIKNPYYSLISQRCHLVFNLLLFWSIITLSFGLIMKDIPSFFPLPMFIIGIPIVIMISTFYKNDVKKLFIKKEVKGYDYLMKALVLLDYIETYPQCREKEILLNSYIHMRERECPKLNCELKKHLKSQKDQMPYANIHLLLFIEIYFREGISQFPQYTLLRIYYSVFLYNKLQKKHKARIELYNATLSFPSYYDKFMIHKCRKEYNPSADSFCNEISNSLIYLTEFNQFKEKLSKVSQLYLDFWNLLNLSSEENQNHIGKLSNIGYNINKIITQIHLHFDNMYEINSSDKVSLKYYCDFLSELLNDNNKAKIYQEKLASIGKDIDSMDKKNIIDVDIELLTRSDTVQFMVVSLEKTEPYINEISLGFCESLGYIKKELIGQSLNLIIPDIFKESHDRLLKEKYADFSKKSIDDQIDKIQYKTFDTICLSKLKFVIPIFISPGMIPNELDEYYFIAKVSIDKLFFSRNDQTYVLTNANHIICNYSSSAIHLLDLNSNDLHDILIDDYMTEIKKDNNDDNNNDNSHENINTTLSTNKHLFLKKRTTTKTRNINMKEFKWDKNKLNGQMRRRRSLRGTDLSEKKAMISPTLFNVIINNISINNQHLGILFHFEMNKERRLGDITLLGNVFQNNSNKMKVKNDSIINSVYSEKGSLKGKNQQKMNSDFIPQNQDHFVFNLYQQKYALAKEGDNHHSNTIIEKITKEALSKYIKVNTDEESESGSYSYSNSNTNSRGEQCLSITEHSSSHASINKKKSTILPDNNLLITEEFYHVNLSKIQLSIYNYNKKQFDMNVYHEKISFVDQKIREYTYNTQEDQSEQIKIKKDKAKVKYVYDLPLMEKNEFLTKQLEYSLTKYENHEEIMILKFLSLLVALITIGEGIGLLFFFNDSTTQISTSDYLISISYDLLQYSIISIFLVREIALLKDGNYSLLYMDKTQYRNEILADLLTSFHIQEALLNDIMATSNYLSEENYAKLYHHTMEVFMIKKDLTIDSYNITLFASISISLDSLYSILIMQPYHVTSANEDIYSYVINGLNGVNINLKQQAIIFHDEMLLQIITIKNNCCLLLGMFTLLSIIFILGINSLYFKVAQKKDDYLNIFFEIKREMILISLRKCEIFQMKLIKRLENSNPSLIDHEDYDDEDDDLYDEMNLTTQLPNNHSKSKRQTNQKCSKENLFIKLFLCLSYGMIVIIFVILISFFFYYLDSVYYSIFVYQAEIILQTRYLNIFNIFREYMFDKNIKVFYKPLEEELDNIFHTIYIFLEEKRNITGKYEHYCSSEYRDIAFKLDNSNICLYINDAFPPVIKDKFSCSKVTFGNAELGLSILLTFYLEEVKAMKNYYESREIEANSKNFYYNYTLLGTPDYAKLYPPLDTEPERNADYNRLHPIKIFNSAKHDELVVLFRYVILPTLKYKNMAMGIGIQNKTAKFLLVSRIVIIAYCILMGLGYVLIWQRKENNLNDTIYKTKNMLNIIPKEVLIQLTSIHKLFKLNLKMDGIS